MLALATTALAALAPCFSQASDPSTLDERLEVLAERMEAERVTHHIPGFALAVVKDDEVVFARGFGLADVETGRAVEPDTLFAIGSTTKAFTSTAVGMLQDDGVLDFDDPVTDYLPDFKLRIEGPDESGDSTVTLRDLLSHRTGFTRMSLVWNGPSVTRDQVLEAAVRAEPWEGFRERFLYSNVMFLAVGMASANAVDVEWEELIQARIFDPLGMSSSSLTTAAVRGDSRMALGYEWNAEADRFDHKRLLTLDTIGPAGSINSNVLDMAQWLRLLLGRGEYGGERLISEAALEETWTEQIQIAGESYYGLGWMLHERDGRRIVEHGGSINGFAAQVSLMPEEGLGYVLLANVTATPLQQLSIPIVFDILLGDIGEDSPPAGSLDEYLGNYRANFATFDDVDFEVLVQNGNLAVDVPTQMVFELEAPDAEGKWYFKLTNTIAISFERDDLGGIVALKMHQSGMTFELPREGVESVGDTPLIEFERFLGSYESVNDDGPLEVLIQRNHLAVDVPGQMVFELRAPDTEGKRQFRVTDKAAVRFNEDADGQVISMTVFENEDEEYEVQRLSGTTEASASRLPTLEELLALRKQGGRARLLAEHGTLRSTGEIHALQSGVTGTYVFEARREPLAFRMRIDFGDYGEIQIGSDGERAWSYSSLEGYTELAGDQQRQTLRRHPLLLEGDWITSFDSVEVLRVETLDDTRVIVARASWSDLPPRTFFADAATGEVVRMEYLQEAGIVRLPTEVTYADFREVEGVPVCFSMIESSKWTGRMVQTLHELEVGVELAPDFHAYEGTRD